MVYLSRACRFSSILALATTLAACAAPIAPADDVPDGSAALDASSTDGALDVTQERSDAAPDVLPDAAPDVTPPPDSAVLCGLCEAYAPPAIVGRLDSMELRELSGLASSERHRGVLWGHNDSGDSARIFALSSTGVRRSTVTIQGAGAVDWEDIALGPCPDTGHCIMIADVGDNGRVRAGVQLYRVREPSEITDTMSLTAERIEVRYPSGAMNCESLVLDPRDATRGYLIEKVDRGAARVFSVTLPPAAGTATATLLTSLRGVDAQEITAADAHPCQNAVIVRTYADIFEFRAAAGQTLAQAFAATPTTITAPREIQGEAIAYARDGQSFFTSSEGTFAPFSRVGCR
ncbi:MAG: hypothetical protein Q8Q09_04010 [Deltaproteobacteria bacterium]|nr:hypothetical protein [Deltaproteobacteria bacterium]